MNITYRNFNESDIENIIKLWNGHSGWETNLNREEFELRFRSSDVGDPILILAVDEDAAELVGLFCFIPLMVTLLGETKKCYRPFGVILNEEFRKKFGISSLLTGKHPLTQLYRTGAELAARSGAVLNYMLPDPRWGKLLKVLPFELHKFPLWSRSLSSGTDLLMDKGYSVQQVTPDDRAVDLLWKSSSSFSCSVTRDSRFYQWKINLTRGRFHLYGVYHLDQLVGLFTLSFKKEDHQFMIGDLVYDQNGPYLEKTLEVACMAAEKELGNRQQSERRYKIAVLTYPYLEPKLKELGFSRDNYDFTLAVHVLNKSISKKEVAPENWSISAND